MRRQLAAGLVALLLAGAAAADEARITMPAALAPLVEIGTHAGLTVELSGSRGTALVTVRQVVRALSVAPPYPLPAASACPDTSASSVPVPLALPAELRRTLERAENAYDVVAEVVAWVSEHVTMDERDEGGQDAYSVLARREGRCSGRANVTVGLLRVAGIPARVAHGMLVTRQGGRWHRWGEAWLGAAGWVPFDPGTAVGLVRVLYVPTLGAVEDTPLDGVRLEEAAEGGYAALPHWRGLRLRPVGGATLRCVGRGDAELVAELVAPDGAMWRREGREELVFPGLLPGVYELRWRRNGRARGPLTLRITSKGELRVDLRAE